MTSSGRSALLVHVRSVRHLVLVLVVGEEREATNERVSRRGRSACRRHQASITTPREIPGTIALAFGNQRVSVRLVRFPAEEHAPNQTNPQYLPNHAHAEAHPFGLPDEEVKIVDVVAGDDVGVGGCTVAVSPSRSRP